MRRVIVMGVASIALGAAMSGASAAPTPEGISWGGRHFADRVSLAHWLERRGVRYSTWAARHPLGVYLLAHPAPPPLAPAPPAVSVTPVTASPSRGGSGAFEALTLALVALLLAFGVAGGAVVRRVPAPPSVAFNLSGARVGATAGGLAILVGAFLTHWL